LKITDIPREAFAPEFRRIRNGFSLVNPGWPMVFGLLCVVLSSLTFPAEVEQQDARDQATVFKIFIEESGVYSIGFGELKSAGLESEGIPCERISLHSKGKDIPFWITGAEDGTFGPGDSILFTGHRLKGDYSFLDEYSAYNCYFLRLGGKGSPRGKTLTPPGPPDCPEFPMEIRHHMEEDIVMVRFKEQPKKPVERWYWSRLAVTDKEPFRIGLSLKHMLNLEVETDAADLGRQLNVHGAETSITSRLEEIYSGLSSVPEFRIRLAFKGWSVPRNKPKDFPDHQVDVSIGGRKIGVIRWNAKDEHIEEIKVPGEFVKGEEIELAVRVGKRRYPDTGDPFVDVVLFNWLEIEYPRGHDFKSGQSRFDIVRDPENRDAPGCIALTLEGNQSGYCYSFSGERIPVKPRENRFIVPEQWTGPFFVVVGEGLRPPVRLVMDRPSRLKVRDRQADYLIVTHTSLREGVLPLAEYHRSQGMKVAVIDIEDIYDEFHWGIPNPIALKDFFSWAHDNWESPRPRFVLLAGDASWDWKNSTVSDANYADWTYRPGEVWSFVKNSSTPYAEEASANKRNLVPTWGYRSREGHAASDNWLVSVAGDDIYADFAVGRIPVATTEEMKAVAEKIIAYDAHPGKGEWRKRLLFITNENKGFQRSSDSSSEFFSDMGFEVEKVYPNPEEANNERHTRRLLDLFDRGLLMVQFLGHGGRYIWRTGPPDLKKNHDLFTLEDLDRLIPNTKLPVVISLTCYSAPFDHPTADSIGEKFLRMPDKGAVAVFAASWRNSPSSVMGKTVMDEMIRPGITIGEAVNEAKRKLRNPILVETYNLLGDPAMHLAVAPEIIRQNETNSENGEERDQ